VQLPDSLFVLHDGRSAVILPIVLRSPHFGQWLLSTAVTVIVTQGLAYSWLLIQEHQSLPVSPVAFHVHMHQVPNAVLVDIPGSVQHLVAFDIVDRLLF
jgi:hypothetical protein